jgi:hypothetical protein
MGLLAIPLMLLTTVPGEPSERIPDLVLLRGIAVPDHSSIADRSVRMLCRKGLVSWAGVVVFFFPQVYRRKLCWTLDLLVHPEAMEIVPAISRKPQISHSVQDSSLNLVNHREWIYGRGGSRHLVRQASLC